jgi:hypothetical protein
MSTYDAAGDRRALGPARRREREIEDAGDLDRDRVVRRPDPKPDLVVLAVGADLTEVRRDVRARLGRVEDRSLSQAAGVDRVALDGLRRRERSAVGQRVQPLPLEVGGGRVDHDDDEQDGDQEEPDHQHRGLAVLVPRDASLHRSSLNSPYATV